LFVFYFFTYLFTYLFIERIPTVKSLNQTIRSTFFNTTHCISVKALLRRVAMFVLAIGITSCGGGDGNGTGRGGSIFDNKSSAWQKGVFKSADNYADKCAVPRTGINPETNKSFTDKKGSVQDENNFLRSWSNDTYLWYNEIPDTNPASSNDPLVYFDLLRTSAKTPSGVDKDQFHFTYDSAEWYALSETGISSGYGFELAWISNTPPRNVVIAYTEPGSPAANANVMRGMRIVKVDGADLVDGNDITTLNKGLFPSRDNEAHTFVFSIPGKGETTVTLQSAQVTKTPVQNVKTIDTPTGKVGYLLFNDHILTAERGLYNAMNTLSSAGISDLVLDVRYNGGGYLFVASELAYMIAGATATKNKIFEKTIFNDKYTSKDIFGGSLEPTPFYGSSADIGGAFPTLNLPRVFVITTNNTCSASEAIINGLRGVNVEVIQIGEKTCGKPYGFYPQPNCGTTYFSIQFKGINEKGFGEYSDGFVPSAVDNGMDRVKGCAQGDDFTHALGDSAEYNLAVALQYRVTGLCGLPTASSSPKLQKMSGEDRSNVHAIVNKEPGLSNRIMQR
jgi:carboxyl-terminal processing protease